eukprot:scaffold266372_cov33-Tisochrysis_lutea.AAC.2
MHSVGARALRGAPPRRRAVERCDAADISLGGRGRSVALHTSMEEDDFFHGGTSRIGVLSSYKNLQAHILILPQLSR